MRMKIPITGTVKGVEPHISGDLNDPISMISLDLGDVSWTLINLDLDAEEMEIEVTPSPSTDYDTGQVDGEGKPIFAQRPATEEEKHNRREAALNLSLSRMSKQALYALSGSPRLKNPFRVEPE